MYIHTCLYTYTHVYIYICKHYLRIHTVMRYMYTSLYAYICICMYQHAYVTDVYVYGYNMHAYPYAYVLHGTSTRHSACLSACTHVSIHIVFSQHADLCLCIVCARARAGVLPSVCINTCTCIVICIQPYTHMTTYIDR